MKLYESGYSGCIECQISSFVKGGISRDPTETVEIDLKISDANKIIKQINKKLNSDYPLF